MSSDEPAFTRPNWFKARAFYDRMVARAPDRPVFIELGTSEGRSAWHLGQRIKASRKKIKVITVDAFADPADPTLEADCRRHLEPLVREGIVDVVKNDSAGYAAQCPYPEVDFVFVDAAHDYESVRRDIRAWLPKVKRGGTIAGDDFWWRPKHQDRPAYRQVPEVREYPVWRAVNECLNGRFDLTVRQSWAIWWRAV